MERSPKLMPPSQLALRFIAGKYKGSELLLREGQEIIVGRVGDVDMVLAEDMVSRRHARIALENGHVVIEDFDSTNGTFVNGEKIRKEILKEGDRILIGTNILKVTSVDPMSEDARRVDEASAAAGLFEETRAVGVTVQDLNVTMPGSHAVSAKSPGPPRADEAPSSVRARATATSGPTGAGSRSMSGAIHEFPLPYLLQLLESSRKNGVLLIRSDAGDVAKLYFRMGAVVFASINDAEDVPPLKVVFRILTWTHGTFDLDPPEERAFPNEISVTVQELLMEGLRHMDELNNIRPRLPDPGARLVLARPLRPRLRDLSPVELDTFQIALNYALLSTIIDKSPATDLDTAKAVLKLIESGYLRVG